MDLGKLLKSKGFDMKYLIISVLATSVAVGGLAGYVAAGGHPAGIAIFASSTTFAFFFTLSIVIKDATSK